VQFDRDGILLSTWVARNGGVRGRFSGQQRPDPRTSELLGYCSLAGALEQRPNLATRPSALAMAVSSIGSIAETTAIPSNPSVGSLVLTAG
jgi:hypothetical protein